MKAIIGPVRLMLTTGTTWHLPVLLVSIVRTPLRLRDSLNCSGCRFLLSAFEGGLCQKLGLTRALRCSGGLRPPQTFRSDAHRATLQRYNGFTTDVV